MANMDSMVADFLAQARIAVVGVSRTKGDAPNTIYRKLRRLGYEVFPVNPKAETVEGDRCYPNVSAIPDGVEAAVIATRPEVTDAVVRDCGDAGIKRVWMHRSFGNGSLSSRAVTYCRENGIKVIAGGCPMMYCEPVDIGHKCMRWFMRVSGSLPK